MIIHSSHSGMVHMFEILFQVLDDKFSIYEKRSDLKEAEFFLILKDDDPVIDSIRDYMENRCQDKYRIGNYFHKNWMDKAFALVDGIFDDDNRIARKITAIFMKFVDVIFKEGNKIFLNHYNYIGTMLVIFADYGIIKKLKTKEEYICLIDEILDELKFRDSELEEYNVETGRISDAISKL